MSCVINFLKCYSNCVFEGLKDYLKVIQGSPWSNHETGRKKSLDVLARQVILNWTQHDEAKLLFFELL